MDEEGTEKKWSLEDDEEEEGQEDGSDSMPQEKVDDYEASFDKFAPKKLTSKVVDDDDNDFGAPLLAKGKGKLVLGKLTTMAVPQLVTPRPPSPQAQKHEEEEEDIDPLDAYMMGNEKEMKTLLQTEAPKPKPAATTVVAPSSSAGTPSATLAQPQKSQNLNDDDEEEDTSKPLTEEDLLKMANQTTKKKELQLVNHDTIEYEDFRKDFYIETPEIGRQTPDEVKKLRDELDGIKIRGKDCPKPIKNWSQAGMFLKLQDILKKAGFEGPTPIQAQAIPAIMSGRDVIGIAKTGSGKTLAFLLPLFRHIMDQRPLEEGEGCIALILTPTRELAMQIFTEAKRFTKSLKLRAVCAYGGSAIKDQIAELKRGAEIIACTPGRMIDLLTANQGRVTNLRRVTYLVMDEADRMFDMGFEPQVMKIINNIRPDRQTVLFSATFPRQMEALARRVLSEPLEILVGGRSVVSDTVTQHVVVLEEEAKFFKLLEVLGNFFDEDKRILIFVDTQDAADNLFKELVGKGYPCLSLHGGKDQMDRDQILDDFKTGSCPILIATSVAARGLDVKQLQLVINYEVPNHLEDYVHRCGRTGRAGATGVAYTFITPQQDKFAGDIIKALKESHQEVPSKLQELWDQFSNKVKEGTAAFQGGGFGGRGLDRIENDRETVKKVQKKALGVEDTEEQQVEVDEEGDLVSVITKSTPILIRGDKSKKIQTTAILPVVIHSTLPKAAQSPSVPSSSSPSAAPTSSAEDHPVPKAKSIEDAIKAAKSKAAALNATLQPVPRANVVELLTSMTKPGVLANNSFFAEVEINDYPPQAKFKVTHKENISRISDFSGAAITTRGVYLEAGKIPKEGERKLYLLIEGPSQAHVEKAVTEIQVMLKEATLHVIGRK